MIGSAPASLPDQTGRTAFITGANTGIGFEAALALAGSGARVLLGCRDVAKGEAALACIRSAVPAADVALIAVDLADLASVARAAQAVNGEPRLDLLINNAGVMHPPLARTAQGLELQFGVNHLAHFALTGHLLGKLAEQAGARVVTVSSIAHKMGRIDFANLDAARGYVRSRFYFQSKLANMLFMGELARRLAAAGSPVISTGCHPGVATTELSRNTWSDALAFGLFGAMLNSAREGAQPTLQAATDPAARNGDYFGPQGFMEMRGPSGHARIARRGRDEELAARLWEQSVALASVDPGLAPAG